MTYLSNVHADRSYTEFTKFQIKNLPKSLNYDEFNVFFQRIISVNSIEEDSLVAESSRVLCVCLYKHKHKHLRESNSRPSTSWVELVVSNMSAACDTCLRVRKFSPVNNSWQAKVRRHFPRAWNSQKKDGAKDLNVMY